MPLVYASESDLLAGWDGTLGDPPEGPTATRLLLFASHRVRHATRAALYATTSGGLPSDLDEAAAFKTATCQQVTFWSVNDIDPAKAATLPDQLVKSKKLGGREVVYHDVDASVAAVRRQSYAALCDDALFTLDQLGLLGRQPARY